jgi:putative acetyltransferase
MLIRDERIGDQAAIDQVIAAAFADHPHSNQREPCLVNSLRDSKALTVSLVAEDHGDIIGHIAFSPVRIGGVFQEWYGLGPVSVQPEWQRQGIGQALINYGLERLREMGANGCVLLGEPEYYGRFGFKPEPGVQLEGVPPEFFLTLSFGQPVPNGRVDYHPAFREVA